MSKLSKEEIIARRRKMQEEALRSVAKTEQLNIRIDEESISRLYALSIKQAKPVGTMVREWIMHRLSSEEGSTSETQTQQLIELISGLQARIDRWDSILMGNQAPEYSQAAADIRRAKAVRRRKR